MAGRGKKRNGPYLMIPSIGAVWLMAVSSAVMALFLLLLHYISRLHFLIYSPRFALVIFSSPNFLTINYTSGTFNQERGTGSDHPVTPPHDARPLWVNPALPTHPSRCHSREDTCQMWQILKVHVAVETIPISHLVLQIFIFHSSPKEFFVIFSSSV